MTPEQVEFFRALMAKSKIDAESIRRARRADPEDEYPYVRGLNAGLEHAMDMFAKALAYDPARPGRLIVTYPKPFGPHTTMKVDDDGSWVQITEEHT